MVGLKPIGQNAEQQMARQVRGRSSSEYGVPPSPKRTDIEIAQTRDLDVDCLAVRRGWTDLDAWHGVQVGRRLGEPEPALTLSLPAIW